MTYVTHGNPEFRVKVHHVDGLHRAIPDYGQSKMDWVWVFRSIPGKWAVCRRIVLDTIQSRVYQYPEVWMRPITGCCAVLQCAHLVWEVIGVPTVKKRGRRRRICDISGKVPSFMQSCPVDQVTRQVAV